MLVSVIRNFGEGVKSICYILLQGEKKAYLLHYNCIVVKILLLLGPGLFYFIFLKIVCQLLQEHF